LTLLKKVRENKSCKFEKKGKLCELDNSKVKVTLTTSEVSPVQIHYIFKTVISYTKPKLTF